MTLQTCPGKKSLSVTSQEKNCLFLLREKKKVMFSCSKEKNNLNQKKNHTPTPGIYYEQKRQYILYF